MHYHTLEVDKEWVLNMGLLVACNSTTSTTR